MAKGLNKTILHIIMNLGIYIGVILLAIFGISISHEFKNNANDIEKDLRVEFNKIAPLPDATVVGTSHGNKYESGMAWVDSSYNSTLTMTEIDQYYNEQFVKNGWQFYKEKSVSIWGKDYGAKDFIYKKGDYEAVLSYTAPNPDTHQTFVVSTNWGFND